MQTGIIQDYINVGHFEDVLFEMYKDERERWRDAGNSDFLDEEFDDEILREMAWNVTERMNENMKKYLHRSDHGIDGNFADILNDYAQYRTGTCDYLNLVRRPGSRIDTEMFEAMIRRLDSGVDSPRANDDRDYLSGWIFKDSGTWGFRYNFSEMIADSLYRFENALS